MNPRRLAATVALAAGLVACQGGGQSPVEVVLTSPNSAVPPLTAFDVNWKDRLDQPYVFLELVGDYTDARRQLPTLAQHAAAQGVRPSGPPFALFYDDPSRVPVEFCRARICWPVATTAAVTGPLGYDVLANETVVYGYVRGNYGQLDVAYPDIFEHMREGSWVLTGPIREIYLVDPGSVQTSAELVSELQMPARPLY